MISVGDFVTGVPNSGYRVTTEDGVYEVVDMTRSSSGTSAVTLLTLKVVAHLRPANIGQIFGGIWANKVVAVEAPRNALTFL